MSKILIVRVKERGSKTGNEYHNKINLSDPSLLTLVLKDLENMFQAPIKKACLLFLEGRERKFPFSP